GRTADQLERWDLGKLLISTRFRELRWIVHAKSNKQSDDNENRTEEERKSPPPAHEARRRQGRDQDERQRRQDAAGRRALLGKVSERDPALLRRALRRNENGTAPFAAQCDALNDAQQGQYRRRGGSYLLGGRQQADGRGTASHHQQRRDQCLFATQSI